MEELVHCSANWIPLSPICFLERAARIYKDNTSIVYGGVSFSWRETHERCLKLASALNRHLEIAKGDIVATLAPNIPALYELHFGVPMAGAVISALNTNLDAITLASILEQLEAKIIFVDYQYVKVALEAIDSLCKKKSTKTKLPSLVLIPECDNHANCLSIVDNHEPKPLDYDSLLEKGGADDFVALFPDSEFDPISVNFTSGSTGNPKGVVYSHRAAYLNCFAQIFRFDMRHFPVLLWTVDMFRCNGWCLAWAMAALGGTNICLRKVSSQVIFDSIFLHRVTHFCGPPVLLNIIAEAPEDVQRTLPGKVHVIVAGPMPNSRVLSKVEELGFSVTFGYGMTEALGPAVVRPWNHKSDATIADDDSEIVPREGLYNILVEGFDVKDPVTMNSVPNDGKTIGELMFRSNTLMSGYFKNSKGSEEAFRGGWYHTRDLGVRHPNGFIQMMDRAQDIIVSGDGSMLSTLEVEAVLLSNPKVLEAAVVGQPDISSLKEVPCGFVKLKEGCVASPEEIIDFCGSRLPRHMIPKMIILGDLPVNFTGKVQKFILREKAKAISISLP